MLTDEELRLMIDKRMGRDVMDYEGASFSLRSLADEIYDKACDDCAEEFKEAPSRAVFYAERGVEWCLSLKHQTLDSGGSDD